MKAILIIILFSNWTFAQTYSKYLTDKEVKNFFSWEMADLKNNKADRFEISNEKLRISNKLSNWFVKFIIIPEGQSTDDIDFFFKETFDSVRLNQFIEDDEIQFLKQQFFDAKRGETRFISRELNTSISSKLSKNSFTIIYSVPLTTRDKGFIFLLKDYSWDNYAGECVINVYKKTENGSWTLYKTQTVSGY
jgi:hypothetical protein